MKYAEKPVTEFTDATFSKDPVPGGGGVSALAGALGTALGGMVCNLTTGKKKYAQYEDDIQRIMKEANEIKDSLIGMIDQDAENFLPLSKAYGLPTGTEEEKAHKAEVMEKCLKVACSVPVDIVKTSYKVIALMKELSVKGSSLALSDVGVGVTLLRGAITGGWLNVVININSIKDAEYVKQIREEVEPLVTDGMKKCDEIYMNVWKTLQK